jgi:hypothetical protein
MSVLFILSFVIAVIILLLLKFFLKKLSKSLLGIKKNLIYEYDNIFYLLSISQYKQELDKESLG